MSTAKPVTGPRLEFVVAVARNGVIGLGNGLPWRLPADLAHFKRITLGHPVLMGRRTWQSIGRPLPGRRNLVLTRDREFRADGADVVHSLPEALAAVPAGERLMVIGGGELYRETLAAAEVLHLTEVHADPEGDAHFPDWRREDWQEISREAHPADERHTYPYSFVTLTRRGA
ncbi:MAG: dihydrofolate reductase [Proteobacteria bacterium]|nr:dihydrofolate reductase [Pseudomonadota bacterium]